MSNPSQPPGYRVGQAEFLAVIAALSALNSIAIDIMLPAFGHIRTAFGLAADATQVSLIVTFYLAGLGAGQFFYGPLADAYGRKKVLFAGLLLYILGAAGCVLSPSLELMLAFRLLWGFGAAGPRVVSVAIVRDRYSGDEMARVMAIVMAVFMLVPAVAPTIGQAILLLGSWHYPFVFSALFAVGVGFWAVRLRETLPPNKRRPLSLSNTLSDAREVFRHRTTAGMMIAMMFSMGAFLPYLGSGQLIYDQVYGRGAQYAYWFGFAALFMGVASTINSVVVRRVGSRTMLIYVFSGYLAIAAVFLVLSLASGGSPSFPAFFILTTLLIMGHIVIGALTNSLAMQDVGHIAGTASAVIGTVTTLGGSLLGSLIDRTISDSVLPFAAGMVIYGATASVFALRALPARTTGRLAASRGTAI